MKTRWILYFILACLVMTGANDAFACTACFGKSDSSMAQGMNWGIFTLLGFIGMVLAGVAGFFVFLVRRAASMNSASAQPSTDL